MLFKLNNNKMLFINILGILLLLLKLLGVQVLIGYLFIFTMILWQVAFIIFVLIGIFLLLITGFFLQYLEHIRR